MTVTNRSEFCSFVEEYVQAQVNEKISDKIKENDELKSEINKLRLECNQLKEKNNRLINTVNQNMVFEEPLKILKGRLSQCVNKDEKRELLLRFLRCFFVEDFSENTYDCPLWLAAIVAFYRHKETVIELLKILDIDAPNNLSTFRLPQDWTVDELDVVFETMSHHIVCNSCTYEDNLRFWAPNSLSDVYSVCHSRTYSEIPWQFLLRNPNLLKKEYLEKIGKMAYEEPYIDGWRYFFEIDKYQNMTEEQIKTIIRNIDGAGANISNENSVSAFLLRHLDLIEDGILIDKIYKKYWDSYSFRYGDSILKMPIEYLGLWVKEKAHEDPNEALVWITNNKNNFSEEQKDNLLKLVMTEVLK